MTAQARYLILALCLMLGACSAFQTPVPQTFNQKHAYALHVISSINSTAKHAFLAGHLSTKEGKALNAQMKQAIFLAAEAKKLQSDNPDEALAKIEAAVALLAVIEIELEKQL